MPCYTVLHPLSCNICISARQPCVSDRLAARLPAGSHPALCQCCPRAPSLTASSAGLSAQHGTQEYTTRALQGKPETHLEGLLWLLWLCIFCWCCEVQRQSLVGVNQLAAATAAAVFRGHIQQLQLTSYLNDPIAQQGCSCKHHTCKL
jgi:hypothetical protein